MEDEINWIERWRQLKTKSKREKEVVEERKRDWNYWWMMKWWKDSKWWKGNLNYSWKWNWRE